MNAWQNDWTEFVNHVAGLYEAGDDDAAISVAVSGNTIHWQGVIETLDLDDGSRVLQLSMPEVRRSLRNGKVLVGNCVAVSTRPGDDDAWRRLAPGDSVTLVAKMPGMGLIGPPITIADDEGYDDVVLMLLVAEGRPGQS